MKVSHFVKICQLLTILHQLICRGVANFGTRCILVYCVILHNSAVSLTCLHIAQFDYWSCGVRKKTIHLGPVSPRENLETVGTFCTDHITPFLLSSSRCQNTERNYWIRL